MMLRQIHFERPSSNNGKIEKTVWVDEDWKLKIGDIVSFEDSSEIKWIVAMVYTSVIESTHLYCKWGLDLPKSQRTER